MYWTVKKVEPLEEYRLLITFEGNVKKVFDMKPYLEYPLYSPLKSIPVFSTAHTNGETVVWNNEIDIAPETLYEKSLDYLD